MKLSSDLPGNLTHEYGIITEVMKLRAIELMGFTQDPVKISQKQSMTSVSS